MDATQEHEMEQLYDDSPVINFSEKQTAENGLTLSPSDVGFIELSQKYEGQTVSEQTYLSVLERITADETCNLEDTDESPGHAYNIAHAVKYGAFHGRNVKEIDDIISEAIASDASLDSVQKSEMYLRTEFSKVRDLLAGAPDDYKVSHRLNIEGRTIEYHIKKEDAEQDFTVTIYDQSQDKGLRFDPIIINYGKDPEKKVAKYFKPRTEGPTFVPIVGQIVGFALLGADEEHTVKNVLHDSFTLWGKWLASPYLVPKKLRERKNEKPDFRIGYGVKPIRSFLESQIERRDERDRAVLGEQIALNYLVDAVKACVAKSNTESDSKLMARYGSKTTLRENKQKEE